MNPDYYTYKGVELVDDIAADLFESNLKGKACKVWSEVNTGRPIKVIFSLSLIIKLDCTFN